MANKYSFKNAWGFFLHRILHISIGKKHYLRLNTDIDMVNKQLDGFDLPVKELTYEDFLKGNKTNFNEKKLAVIKARLQDKNYKCYGILENDVLIYSTWFSTERLGLSVNTKPIYLSPNEGLLEDSYCDPIARGRGLHSKMNYFRIKKLYELGKDRVIAIVLDGNTPAMKVQLKSGFEELGFFYNGYFLGFKVNTLKKEIFDGR
jgi:hypothetical protein